MNLCLYVGSGGHRVYPRGCGDGGDGMFRVLSGTLWKSYGIWEGHVGVVAVRPEGARVRPGSDGLVIKVVSMARRIAMGRRGEIKAAWGWWGVSCKGSGRGSAWTRKVRRAAWEPWGGKGGNVQGP